MSEFLRTVPTEKLEEVLCEAERDNLQDVISLVSPELARRSFALSNGVYDAIDGTTGSYEHEEDERWIRSNN